MLKNKAKLTAPRPSIKTYSILTPEQCTLHHDLIFKTALSYVHQAHDARDISQEVYVILLKKCHTFKGLSSPKTWIYRITVNTTLNYIKKKQLQTNNKYQRCIFYEQPTYCDSPEKCIASKELYNNSYLVKKHVSSLPKTQQRVLRMYLYLKKRGIFSQKKIATHLGISIKALESLIHRAKKNFKKSFLAKEFES